MVRFLLSRSSVLLLIVLLLLVVALSYLVPQSFIVPAPLVASWRGAHEALLPVVDLLGLHHVFTTSWFAVVAACFVLALALSCLRQFSAGRRHLCQVPRWVQGAAIPVASAAQARQALLARGYRPVGQKGTEKGTGTFCEEDRKGTGTFCEGASPRVEKLVKQRWGYWGNLLFHGGLVIIAVAVLVMVLTQQRGMLRMEEHQVLTPEYPWTAEEHGVLALPLTRPAPVVLERFQPEFWETEDLKAMHSRLGFLPPGGEPRELELSINAPQWYGGLKIYQELQSGHFFHLRFSAPAAGEVRHTLTFVLPPRRTLASYNDFTLSGIPYLVRGKYYADRDQKGLSGGRPLLVLRFYHEGTVLGEARLMEGETARLAGFTVTLEKAAPWAGIIFTDTKGIAFIFLGFFVIICGGLLHYFCVPREAFLAGGATPVLSWRALRFQEFYRDEYEDLARELAAPPPH